MPDRYPDVEITFAHLLSHRSGIPHYDRIWKDGKLVLALEPGSRMMYSTRGYGVLGEVLCDITGKSFNQLVKEYIGETKGLHRFEAEAEKCSAPAG